MTPKVIMVEDASTMLSVDSLKELATLIENNDAPDSLEKGTSEYKAYQMLNALVNALAQSGD